MEFEVCLSELRATGHSRSYPSWLKDNVVEPILASAWKRHRAQPRLSSSEYLHGLHRDLNRRLHSVRLVYLDTCYWIRLREVVMNDPRADPRFVSILAKLRELKAKGKIFCPFSFLTFIELNKQTSDNTRRAMAALIDELAEGICLQPPHAIDRIELHNQILQFVLGKSASQLNEWIWTKAGWVCGELLPESDAFEGEDKEVIKKIFTDLAWNGRLVDLVEFLPKAQEPPHLQELAELFNQDAKIYRSSKMSYAQVLEQEKAHQVRALLRTNLPAIAEEIKAQYPAECARFELQDASAQRPDPAMLPSVQIRAAIHASYFVSTPTMRFEAADLIDAMHASLAVPYCDILFVERPLAHRLTTKPIDFGKIYGKAITGDADEFAKWLSRIDG